jgi:hypothetical protein
MKPRLSTAAALTAVLVIVSATTAAALETHRSGADCDSAHIPLASVSLGRIADAPEATSALALQTYLPVVFNEYADCSAVATLLGPADGASLDTLLPLFRWHTGTDPRVDMTMVEVSLDPEFKPVLAYDARAAKGPMELRLYENFAPATTLYWRVRLACGGNLGPATPAWSFTTGSGGVLPPAPTLLAPANGSTAPAGRMIVQWSPVSGGVEYLVTWRSTGMTYRSIRWVADTQTSFSVYAGTTYEWWVAGRSDYALGADSPIWRFTVPAGSE